MYIYYVYISAVKRLIGINRIQNKSLFTYYMSVYCVYYVYININTYMYIFKKNMLSKYIYWIIKSINKYINVYTCKYIFNIYCVCIYIYIINKQYTHIMQTKLILDAINHFTAHTHTVSHRSEYTPQIFLNNLLYIFMWQHWRNYTLLWAARFWIKWESQFFCLE